MVVELKIMQAKGDRTMVAVVHRTEHLLYLLVEGIACLALGKRLGDYAKVFASLTNGCKIS